MLMSAFFGTVVSAYTQSALWGVIAAVAAGITVAMIMAGFAFRMKADLILTGIAMNTFASGATVFLMYVVCNDKASTSSLPSCNVPNIQLPFIRDIPVIGEVFSGHNMLTYLGFLSVIVVYFLIYKTPLGLRIRAVGEKPDAAQSVGVKVIRVQFAALFLSGVFAGLGGAFMSMGYMSFFSRDMIAGRGFIALAAQNMGGADADCFRNIWYSGCAFQYASDPKGAGGGSPNAAISADNSGVGNLFCNNRTQEKEIRINISGGIEEWIKRKLYWTWIPAQMMLLQS